MALLFLALDITSAHATGIDFKKIPGIKHYETPTSAEFQKSGKKIEEKSPYGDPLLAYEFFLPQKWTDNLQSIPEKLSDGQKDISASIFSMMGRYVSDAKNLQRSYVTVEGQKLDHEIRAKYWLANQILTTGVTLSALTEKSMKEVEALYVQMEKDTSYVVRARAIINGDKIVVIRHFLPQDNYKELMVEQDKIVSSFKLLNPSEETIEKREVFGFLDQSYFDYPESWRLKEKPILTVDRMSAMLFQEKMQRDVLVLEGHVKINTVSRLLKTTLAQEVDTFKKALDVPEYSVGKLIETLEYKKDPSISFQETQIYELLPKDKINMRPYELLVSIMQGQDYYYIVSMISPSRDLDFYGWAKNIEVSKIIIESMRRHKDSKAVDPNDPYYDYLKEVQ